MRNENNYDFLTQKVKDLFYFVLFYCFGFIFTNQISVDDKKS